jgi:hypothetical protein
MINFPYHFARAEGRLARNLFRSALPFIVDRKIHPPRTMGLDVFAYSGEEALPEQVASIRSFIKHAGRPNRFIVVSDGTHSERSIGLIEQIDPVVQVQQAQPPPPYKSEKLHSYLTSHSTGKQLALVMSLPVSGPALYVDSDVLFFPGASDLAALSASRNGPAYYLADCQFSGDPRLIYNSAEKENPVNTGVLLLFQKLDWSLSIDRFLALTGEPTFFSNQTLTHLTMHANGARSFDPAKYVLQLDDQFVYRDYHAKDSLVLRHYVNPVRHKFWTHFAR